MVGFQIKQVEKQKVLHNEITLQGHELGGEEILLRYPNNTGSPGSQSVPSNTIPVAPVKKKLAEG